MVKQCQSCGIPLQTTKAGDCRGTEADGKKSENGAACAMKTGILSNLIAPLMT